jgi:hypothetical protein
MARAAFPRRVRKQDQKAKKFVCFYSEQFVSIRGKKTPHLFQPQMNTNCSQILTQIHNESGLM